MLTGNVTHEDNLRIQYGKGLIESQYIVRAIGEFWGRWNWKL